MGKGKKRKLHITATEHKHVFGGFKKPVVKKHRKLPFNYCRLTFQETDTPCMTPDGVIFDYPTLLKFIQEHKRDPISGSPLRLKEITRVNLFRNSFGKYHCPVSRKVFTDYTKICVIKPTGNAYSYSAVKEMCVDIRNYFDLVRQNVPFSKTDIIIIQDPHNLFTTSVDDYWYFRRQREERDKKEFVVKNKTTARVFEKLEKEKKKMKDMGILRSQQSNTNTMSTSFTDSSMNRKLKDVRKKVTVGQLREEMYERIRARKKIGYVTMHIEEMGKLEFQIMCKWAPMTSHNFMQLCERGYYDNTVFHRLVKNFVVQGGDPTGTGKGGESIFGGPFKDEFHQLLKHDQLGTLSMANSGPGTNKSQFYITLRESLPSLNKKHSVFGRLIGGKEVLMRMEARRVDEGNHPVDPIRIKYISIEKDPYKEDLMWQKKAKDRERKRKEDNEVRNWFSEDSLPKMEAHGSGVGKYIQKKRKRKDDKKDGSSNDTSIDFTFGLGEKSVKPDLKKRKTTKETKKNWNFDTWK